MRCSARCRPPVPPGRRCGGAERGWAEPRNFAAHTDGERECGAGGGGVPPLGPPSPRGRAATPGRAGIGGGAAPRANRRLCLGLRARGVLPPGRRQPMGGAGTAARLRPSHRPIGAARCRSAGGRSSLAAAAGGAVRQRQSPSPCASRLAPAAVARAKPLPEWPPRPSVRRRVPPARPPGAAAEWLRRVSLWRRRAPIGGRCRPSRPAPPAARPRPAAIGRRGCQCGGSPNGRRGVCAVRAGCPARRRRRRRRQREEAARAWVPVARRRRRMWRAEGKWLPKTSRKVSAARSAPRRAAAGPPRRPPRCPRRGAAAPGAEARSSVAAEGAPTGPGRRRRRPCAAGGRAGRVRRAPRSGRAGHASRRPPARAPAANMEAAPARPAPPPPGVTAPRAAPRPPPGRAGPARNAAARRARRRTCPAGARR